MDIKTKIIISWLLAIVGVFVSYFIYDRLLILFMLAAAALRADLKDANHPVNVAFKQTNIWTILCAIYICFVAVISLYYNDEIFKGHYNIVPFLLVIFWPFVLGLLIFDIKTWNKKI